MGGFQVVSALKHGPRLNASLSYPASTKQWAIVLPGGFSTLVPTAIEEDLACKAHRMRNEMEPIRNGTWKGSSWRSGFRKARGTRDAF